MKTQGLPPSVVLALFLLLTGCRENPAPTAVGQANPLLGAWERAVDQPPGARQVKVWTEDRFLWIVYDAQGATMASGCGRYTRQDGKYVETLEAAPANLPALLHKPLPFDLAFDSSNRLTQSGTLPGIGKITETFSRMPSPATP